MRNDKQIAIQRFGVSRSVAGTMVEASETESKGASLDEV
jgi:hypothetical protein